MYTSCGWFFDEISGLETTQVLHYAGRALQLAEQCFGESLEGPFLERLQEAKSNLPEHRDGKHVYEKFVKPTMLTWERVGAHYAVSSLFESYAERARVFCYTAERQDYQSHAAGKSRLVVGRARFLSEITHDAQEVSFGVLHFGDHNVNGGVRKYQGEDEYQALARELTEAFQRADFPQIIRLFDKGFGQSTYSLKSLFRDEQRKVIRQVLHGTLSEAEAVYRKLYHDHLPTMRFLADLGAPLPRALKTALEFVVSTDLRWVFKDDEPDLEQARLLLQEAATWHVPLDTAGLAYRMRGTLGRMAERLRHHPGDLALLQSLEAVVDLVQGLPFEVDLWQAQNAYYELMRAALPDLEARAATDDTLLAWLERFLALGEKLGVHVGELKKKTERLKKAPSPAELVQEVLTQRRVPCATYRLQFNAKFTFADAAALVPYLHGLGVSTCYASPVLKARPGSLHGYDTTDHSQLNPELGGEPAFDAFAAALQQHGMDLLLDTVPNHMGIGHASNPWWQDVLENGPSSIYASCFDIDWNPVNPDLKNKVLLPILEDQYGKVLEDGKIRLTFDNGAFFLDYYDHRLPVAPRGYTMILERQLDALAAALGSEHEHLLELRSILTAISYLPPRDETSPEKIAERNREKEIIKRRLAALAGASTEVRGAIDAALQAFNGKPGDPHSFDLLDGLIDQQAYRPAFWRVATEEINYRRFFDINELAALRVELPEVFQAAHQLYFRLLAEGKAAGLRIDHPDGLWDPTGYFRQLQEQYVLARLRRRLPSEHPPEALAQEVAALLNTHTAQPGPAPARWPLYVVAEKILAEGESLPHDWVVYGTTGYDFLNAVNGLFVAAAYRDAFDRIYQEFTGNRQEFGALVSATKKTILLAAMASEINALSNQLDRIAERNRHYRDFTLNNLTFAIREIIASLSVYRTYIGGADGVALRDRLFIEAAVEQAKKQNFRTAASIFDFIQDNLLMRNLQAFREEDRPRLVGWAMKFQQLTGPVMAKGVEDTAFYVYNRLVSLNEVGGHPDHFGLSVEAFHRQNLERLQHWPHSLLATSTHDTKRSEDVRARLNVLSEIPEEWEAALRRWGQLNEEHKTKVGRRLAPDRNDEYLLYQTLLGAWPCDEPTPACVAQFRQRITAYMEKATREAKVHTSWINPSEKYDAAVRDFVARLLPDRPENPFLADLLPLQRRVAFFGYLNALAQAVLKMTCPGVPDFYQGTELWDFSLVDPDNRRPVDYARRKQLLAWLKKRLDAAGPDLTALAQELLKTMPDGRIKFYTIYQTLHLRRAHVPLFQEGGYEPLAILGDRREHVCAFARVLGEQRVIVVVPRLLVRLLQGVEQLPLGRPIWSNTWLLLPAERVGQTLKHLYTGEALTVGEQGGSPALPLEEVFGKFPLAVLSG
jgi:(1->4)-alpha-D-glucan 1-alpha-D-glucosylmutase